MNISRHLLEAAVALTAAAVLATCGDGTGPGNGGGDTTAPSVTATNPTSGELDVAVTTTVTVTFSERVDPATVTLASFTLEAGATPVGGAVTASGTTATFTPSTALARGTLYTATVTTAVTDTAGNALPANHTWSFTTVPNQGPTADAGPDQDVNRSEMVTLDGSGSSDPESDPLTYTWTQVFGPDVTGGTGTLTGISPSFSAPALVSTVQFDLVVDDGFVPSPPNRVQINVMEDKNNAVFVSPTGNDSNSGSRGEPLLTVQLAINQAAAGAQGADVYVAAGTYVESLQLASGVSLYGGFSAEWERDPDTEVTTISGGSKAVSGIGVSNVSVDGFAILSANAVTAGGSSYGVYLDDSQNVTVAGNEITAGNGMSGTVGSSGAPGANGQPGGPGSPGCEDSSFPCSTCARPAGGTPGAGPGYSGGVGGRPGHASGNGDTGFQGSGPGGGAGGFGTPDGQGNWNPPSQYTGSFGGQGANGSDGAGGGGFGSVGPLGYIPADGQDGGAGQPGSGGGGGGGGGGGSVQCNSYGGGGGGGGAGGGPGGIGRGGTGAGGSFGIWLDGSTNIVIAENTITTGNGAPGGNGGPGGQGGLGGEGGWGGDATRPAAGCPYGGSNEQDDGSNGGRGGTGGRGGRGGHGGGGGGGPSIGIFETAASTSTIANNTFITGNPGPGGSSAGQAGSTGEQADYKKGA